MVPQPAILLSLSLATAKVAKGSIRVHQQAGRASTKSTHSLMWFNPLTVEVAGLTIYNRNHGHGCLSREMLSRSHFSGPGIFSGPRHFV
jgi:hypothetical protein